MAMSTSDADMRGRRVVITGANRGLGAQLTEALLARGAEVVMAVRDTAAGAAVADALRREYPKAAVQVARLDLADLDEVAGFAEQLSWDRVDVLVNNAGVMAIDEGRTAQGVEMQFGVNHLGHFALTAHLMARLLASPSGRIATMSSLGHYAAAGQMDPLLDRPYRRWQAYFHSKLANLLFTAELHRRLTAAGSPVRAVAAHPGVSRTELGTDGAGWSNRVMKAVVPVLTQGAAVGVRPMLRAVVDPMVGGGEFLGPRWVVAGAVSVQRPSAAARDGQAARRVWDLSCRLAGVEPAISAI